MSAHPCKNKANPVTPGCGEGTCSVYCKAADKEAEAANAQNPGTPQWVSGRHFYFLKFFYFYFYVFINLFIYLLAVLGLHCCARAFSSYRERGLLFVFLRELLIAVASLIAPALGARASVVVARGLQSAGSAVVAHGPSCSVSCAIFPAQDSNPCPLH